MEWQYFLVNSTITLLLAFIFFFFFTIFQSTTSKRNKLPPGPRGWPVVGHMFNLGSAPHRTIAHLQPRYGPVVWLKLGSVGAHRQSRRRTLQEPRPLLHRPQHCSNHHNASLALAPYGPRWRMLRRLCTVEMFVNKRINETAGIRRRCVERMLSWIDKYGNGNGIAVGKYVFLAAFNMLGISEDLVEPESETGMEFYGAMKRVMEWSGRPNVSDLFPWIGWGWMDLQGLKRKANRDMGIAFGFAKERMRRRGDGDGNYERDFLDVLLGLGCDLDSGKLSETEIIIFILAILLSVHLLIFLVE